MGLFEANYSGGKYQFAFLAYHMLMMSFVYFKIWQIRITFPSDFNKSLIGLGKDNEQRMLNATSPFSFSLLPERSILRFLKLVACNDNEIGLYQSFVNNRNKTAHSNGSIFLRHQGNLDETLSQVLRAVGEIQSYSKPVIECCYQDFLVQSQNLDEREHLDDDDQVREVLIHQNYLSRKDISYCVGSDISRLNSHPEFANVESLHRALCDTYSLDKE